MPTAPIMSQPLLLPCPFCGGPVDLERARDTREWWGVVCRNTINLGGSCAIQQIPSASEEAAIERWNRRAPQSAPREPAVTGYVCNEDLAEFQNSGFLTVFEEKQESCFGKHYAQTKVALVAAD